MLIQYEAVRGLVNLEDPALKNRLVEKCKEIIISQHSRNWNNQLVLDTLLLLRKLDPQEAERMLDKLGTEKD